MNDEELRNFARAAMRNGTVGRRGKTFSTDLGDMHAHVVVFSGQHVKVIVHLPFEGRPYEHHAWTKNFVGTIAQTIKECYEVLRGRIQAEALELLTKGGL
jgi:hypothetical protein